MESQNKKLFSTLLMLVGVLFIIVSGGIFVSRTWQYLPEEMKKLLLLVATGALFAGAIYTRKNTSLHITSSALQYLGIAFSGLSMISLLSGTYLPPSLKWAFAMLVMMVPLGVRFYDSRRTLDFLFEALLLDGSLICVTGYSLENDHVLAVLSLGIATMLFSAAAVYCKSCLPEKEPMHLIALVFSILHMYLLVPAILVALATLTVNAQAALLMLPLGMMVFSLHLLRRIYPHAALRFVESIVWVCSSFLACLILYRAFFSDLFGEHIGIIFFAGFVLSLGLLFVKERAEMVWIVQITAFLLSFVQLLIYRHDSLFGDGTCIVYPYALCMAAALVLLELAGKKGLFENSFFHFAGLFTALGANTGLSYASATYALYYSAFFFLAIAVLCPVLFCRQDKSLKAVFRCLSWALILAALTAKAPFGLIICGADFGFEYVCVLLGITVVLFSVFWYHKKEVVSYIAFPAVCLLFTALLLRNLSLQELPNILFLGIVTLTVLLTATCLRNRPYAILSAVVLILVVLYLTKAVWLSISWWVYLFVAGVGLILLAVKKEKE